MGLALGFQGGTRGQQAMVAQVVADSKFPWSSIPGTINLTVTWTNRPDMPQQHNNFAVTTGPLSDGSYFTEMRSDLGDGRHGTTLNGQPGGGDEDLVYDVFHHELGHVLQGYMNSATAVCPLFHGPTSRWAAPANVWGGMIKEGDAETFKDVFSARRKWFNRTGWQLPESNFGRWLQVYAPAGGANFEYDYEFVPYFIG